MQVRLNVLGRKLEVTSMQFYKGDVQEVRTVDNGIYITYYDHSALAYSENALKINLKEALEYPDITAAVEESNNKLIKHLLEVYEDECEKLTNIAIEAMENETGLPFDSHLSTRQKEYKLMQQRVLGIIDTIEEARAFQDGWFNRGEKTIAKEAVQ